MSEWSKVVTDPLGLAGFSLFLVFGLLAKLKNKNERRWITPLAALMALCSLFGGIYLSYKKSLQPSAGSTTQSGAAPTPQQQQTNTKVIQETSGQGSPAVQGVQGDVTITVDQSGESKKKNREKPPPKKNP